MNPSDQHIEGAASGSPLAIYEQIFQCAGIGIALANLDGVIVEANPWLIEKLGYSIEELRAHTFKDYTHPEDTQTNMVLFHDLLKGKINNYKLRKRYITMSGAIFHAGLTVTLFHNPYDKKKAILAIIEDLSELREQERKYSKLFENIRDPLFVFHLDADNKPGKFIEVNRVACDRYGYTVEEFKELYPMQINDPQSSESGFKRYFSELLQNGSVIGEVVHINRKGEKLPTEINGNLVEFDGKRTVISTARDISGRKEQEQKQKEHEQVLIHQSKLAAMGEMLGAIAHQWRQPLNALGLLIQDLEEAHDFNELDEAYLRKTTEMAMEQINYMSRTIDQFRDFYRPSNNSEPFDIFEAIQRATFMVDAVLKNHSIDLIIDRCIFESSPVSICGFRSEFMQVLLNLIQNAKESIIEARKSTRSLRDKITLDCIKEAEQIHIHISDSGTGIAAENLSRIFQPYYSTREDRGTGIGLYISRWIIEKKMLGTLTARNIEHGACFTITLPIEKPISDQ